MKLLIGFALAVAAYMDASVVAFTSPLAHHHVVRVVPSSPMMPKMASLHQHRKKVSLKMSDEDENAAVESTSVGGGTATIPNEIFNLVKSIVGAGVLSLPAGKMKCDVSSLRFYHDWRVGLHAIAIELQHFTLFEFEIFRLFCCSMQSDWLLVL